MANKLLVTGGNGFIGAEVCKTAVKQGYEVIGVARSGAPDLDEPWVEEVTWVSANALEPDTWREHLKGCDGVVHAIGILKEQPDKGVTFGRINGDTAIIAAEEAAKAGVGAFVYVSASTTPPTVDKAYLEQKRRAEAEIVKQNLRAVILRPSLIYGPRRPLSNIVGRALEVAQKIPGVPQEDSPMSVETLAEAAVSAVKQSNIEGILDIEAIEALGKI